MCQMKFRKKLDELDILFGVICLFKNQRRAHMKKLELLYWDACLNDEQNTCRNIANVNIL